MSNLLLAVLAILVSGRLSAQEKVLAGFDPRTDLIADNYEAGRYLIYDCEEGHWTCVSDAFYKNCEEARAQDIETKKISARCAPIGDFPTKKSCFQRQLYMTGQNHGTRFCVLPDWKEKEIVFEFQEG